MEPALVGLCLFCFGEFIASIRLWSNLEFVILSSGECSGETAPIGPANSCSVILVFEWCMDNILLWYSWMLWDGIFLGTVLWCSWIFVHRFETWRRIWTCLEDIEISLDESWAEKMHERVLGINLNWHVWMHECIRSDSGIEHLNASGIVRTGCIFVNSRNLEWSFRRPIELFNESCVLWTFLFGRNFHESLLTETNRVVLWTELSLKWLSFCS